MSCYSRSNASDKDERTHKLLNKMKQLAESGENPAAEPDTVSYNIVMNAYSKSGQKNAPSIVEKLLHELEERFEVTGDWRRKPNSRSINTYLDAWAKSGDKNAYEHTSKLFQQMQSIGKAVKPDVFTYTSLINALAVSLHLATVHLPITR